MKCPITATHKYYWPGRDPSPICIGHLSQVQGVAAAIGCYVRIEEITIDELDDAVTCQQSLSRKEIAALEKEQSDAD